MPEHIFDYVIDMGETTAHVISVWVAQASDIFITCAITFAKATCQYFLTDKAKCNTTQFSFPRNSLVIIALPFKAQTSSGNTVRTSSITIDQTPSWKEAKERAMQLQNDVKYQNTDTKC